IGSAYATVVARIYFACVLFGVIWYREHKRPSGLHDVPFALDLPRMTRLVRLGLPAALQVVLEVGVFGAAGAPAAKITAMALPASQIALNVASFFFMVPLGLSSAAAVRVGQAVGRRDPHGVRLAGWAALSLAIGFALVMSTAFVTIPGVFLRIFTHDPAL